MYLKTYRKDTCKVLINEDLDKTQPIYIYELGQSAPFSGIKVGPYVRDRYLLHYVTEGEGQFCGQTVKRGQGFLICPQCFHSIIIGEKYRHLWFGFGGSAVPQILHRRGISCENQIFPAVPLERAEQFFFDAFQIYENGEVAVDLPLFCEGGLQMLLSFQQESQALFFIGGKDRKEYVKKACNFMKEYYDRSIKITDVANAVGISPKHLCRVFYEEKKISPKQFLSEVRLQSAKELLEGETGNISQIAQAVGYSDALYFSQVFRRSVGISPSEYRQRQKR